MRDVFFRSLTLSAIAVAALVLGLRGGGVRAGSDQPLVVTQTEDSDAASCTAQACSLRSAVLVANSNPDATTIQLPAGMYNLTVDGAGEDAAMTGDLDITSSVKIVGAGEATTIVDGQANDRVFDVRPGGSLSLQVLTVQNGLSIGGGIRADGTLNLLSVDVRANGTLDALSAAGVEVGVAAATIDHSTIAGNIAGAGGIGGIFVAAGGSITITDSVIEGNSSTGNNGVAGIWLNGNGTLRHVRIESNSTDGENSAGGLYAFGTTMIDDTIVTGNSTGEDGAAGIWNDGEMTVRDSIIDSNVATDRSVGGIYGRDGSLTMTRVRVTNNEAGFGADSLRHAIGGVFVDSGSVAVMTDVSIDSNRGKGGSVGGLMNLGNTQVSRASISRNSAGVEDATIQAPGPPPTTIGGIGGVQNIGAAVLSLTNVTISNNVGTPFSGGSAVSAIDSSGTDPLVTLNYVTISGNMVVGASNGMKNAIYISNSASTKNTIVGYNDPPDTICGVPMVSLGNNIDFGHTCGFVLLTDLPDRNPGLLPLQDNGGGLLTQEPQTVSPAIDAFLCAATDTDARGVPRPQGEKCDIGALEVLVLESPQQRVWGDFLCNGAVDLDDAFALLDELAEIGPQFYVAGEGCPALSEKVDAESTELAFAQLPWGDTDCDSKLTGWDALAIMRGVIDKQIPNARCFQVGDSVSIR